MIVNPQFVGTVQKGSQVSGKDLYDSYNNRRLEERQNLINSAADAQAEWDARIEPAIMDMMRSEDPRVRAAAEQRYIQLRQAKARAFNQRYGEGDAAADLESLRARYSDGGLRNTELQYGRERREMLQEQPGAPAQGGGGGGGGGTTPGTTPQERVAKGEATPVVPGAQLGAKITPNRMPTPTLDMGVTAAMPEGTRVGNLGEVAYIDNQKELEAIAAQMLQKEQDPLKLAAAAASFANGGDQKNAAAAQMALTAVKKQMSREAAATSTPLSVRDPKTGRKAMFAQGGSAVPGSQGEPVQAIVADGGEPEVIVPLSLIKQFGPAGAIARVMAKPPVVGGQQNGPVHAYDGVEAIPGPSREDRLGARIAALPAAPGPSSPASSTSPAPQAPA